MSKLYSILDFFVKNSLKFIAVLCFSLAFYLPEVHNKEPSLDKSLINNALVISEKYNKNPLDILEVLKVIQQVQDSTFTKQLLLSLIAVESSFNKHAVSYSGAKGYTQIHPSSGIKLYEPFETEQNIIAGAGLLKVYYEKHGSIQKALYAYNCGNLKKKSCKEYSKKVLSKQKEFI